MPLIGKENRLKKIFNFLKESRAELKKVNWPSKEEVFTSTRVVIISILVIAAVIALIDYVIKTVVFSIIGG
jgi:preprotein translocase subunit SecE